MSNLYTYGCSYTEDFEQVFKCLDSENYDPNFPPAQVKYVNEFLGGVIPKSWPKLLSEKLNVNLINRGQGGTNNQTIFNNFCSDTKKFAEGDYVIIQWTAMHRFGWASSYGWLPVYPSSDYDEKVISKTTQNEILINRDHFLYRNELYNFMEFIEEFLKLKKINVFYWSMDMNLIYELDKDILSNKKYLLGDKIKRIDNDIFNIAKKLGGKIISEETNNKITDGHMAKSGHEVLAELFYQHIISDNRL